MFWILTPYQAYGLQFLSPFHRLSFHFILLCTSFLVWCSPTYFLFCCLCFQCYSQKSSWRPCQGVLFLFSSRNFMTSGLTLKSLINFELIFWVVYDQGPVSFFSMWISSYPSTIYWRDCFFSIECSLKKKKNSSYTTTTASCRPKEEEPTTPGHLTG